MGIFDIKHWLVILLVVALLFGTRRLRSLGSDLGEAIQGFRRASREAEDDLPAAASITKRSEETVTSAQPVSHDTQPRA